VIVFLANVEFAANNRFDAGLVRCIHEMHGAKNIAVVGQGHRGHAKFLDPIDEFLNVASAVEERIITVQVQMNEGLGHEDFFAVEPHSF
jgi:ketol-acid reductoisomerase